MDPNEFKRNPQRVQKALEDKKGALVANEAVKIYIPYRFIASDLAEVGSEPWTVGIFAIVVEDRYYAISTVNAKMNLNPERTNVVNFGGDDYLEFSFEAGNVVVPNLNLVKQDTLVFLIYNEIIAKGRVPWFLEYEDLAKIFASAPKHAGLKVGANHAIIEMIISSIAREPGNRNKYYRHTPRSRKEMVDNPPEIISLRSVAYGATNTTAKLMGAYFDDGLASALVNPSDKEEPIEEILRR